MEVKTEPAPPASGPDTNWQRVVDTVQEMQRNLAEGQVRKKEGSSDDRKA